MISKVRITASPLAVLFAGVLIGFVSGVLAYRTAQDMTQLADVRTARAAELPVDAKSPGENGGIPTDLVRVAHADELAAELRKLGFDVRLMTDDDIEKGTVGKESYSVIVIGREVPANRAATAIRLTHRYLPWVKYAYLQFQYPEMDRHIVLNAQNGWVESLGLKPLSDADFTRLGDDRLSPERFHAMLEKFRN